jgi:predicted PurR-regulated permease PerM
MTDGAARPPTRRVLPRDVWTVLWVTSVFGLGALLLYEIRRVLVWVAIAAFLAAVLSPVVTVLERHGVRRGLAVAAVTGAFLAVSAGLAYAVVSPLVDESRQLADNLPGLVDDVTHAPVVRSFVERFNIGGTVSQVSSDLPRRLLGLSGPVLSAFRTVGGVIVGIVTVFVLTVFLLLYGAGFVRSGLSRVGDPTRRARLERIGGDMLRAVSGWVAGNLLTSLIAAVVSIIVFVVTGLPYSVLLGLWVGVLDLLPLIGATLGAIPAIVVAFVQSIPIGIIVTAYFIAYQQIENHVLQPYVYGRTIQLNPFIVVVALLIGAELAGFLGALFALPVAGVIQVLVHHVVLGASASGANATPRGAP